MIRHLLQIPLLRHLLLVGLLFVPLALQTHAQTLPNLAPLNINLNAYSALRGTLVNIEMIARVSPMPGGTFVVSLKNNQQLHASRLQSRILRETLLRI